MVRQKMKKARYLEWSLVLLKHNKGYLFLALSRLSHQRKISCFQAKFWKALSFDNPSFTPFHNSINSDNPSMISDKSYMNYKYQTKSISN